MSQATAAPHHWTHFERSENTSNTGYVLKNLYVYFWRWATWKVFESTNQPEIPDGGNGVICFITATGYLTGPGFKGMREYLRRTCSHGWIINLTPEGQTPPARNAVFNIETPVAIGLFIRTEGTGEDTAADLKYIALHGTKEEKFDQLNQLTFDSPKWRAVRPGWTAPFTPAATSNWDAFPALNDLLPWISPGVKPNRTWVYGTTQEVLEERLQDLTNETDPDEKAKKFRESRDANLDKIKQPLPGDDTEQNTNTPFRNVVMNPAPQIIRCGYRSFDRQYLIADRRLLHDPAVNLWHGRIPGQVFTYELHSVHPRKGPALHHFESIPDMNALKGSSGGRALPMLHPDGTYNLAPGLPEALSLLLQREVHPSEITYYIAGSCTHTGFVDRFDDELHTPGVRVPITADVELWRRAVEIGKHVVWLHTYGERGVNPEGASEIRSSRLSVIHPSYETPVGKTMPTSIRYDAAAQVLHVGAGSWSHVSKPVRDYMVGGMNVIDSWLGYRLSSPRGRRTSPLDDINVAIWPGEWSIEFSELLSVLTQIVALEEDQHDLLDDILAGDILTLDTLKENGVVWPAKSADRKPHLAMDDGLFADDPPKSAKAHGLHN